MSHLTNYPAEQIHTYGDLNILGQPLLGFFCSRKCPGSVILAAYDLALALRDAGVPVIGGFHAPMEQEVLTLLLRGAQPIVWCPARSIPTRLPPERQAAIAEGRLLVISPFSARRVSSAAAQQRNLLVHSLAALSIVAHAAPGSATETLARRWFAAGDLLLTLDDPANAHLAEMGAVPISDRREMWPEALRCLGLAQASEVGQLPLFDQK